LSSPFVVGGRGGRGQGVAKRALVGQWITTVKWLVARPDLCWHVAPLARCERGAIRGWFPLADAKWRGAAAREVGASFIRVAVQSIVFFFFIRTHMPQDDPVARSFSFVFIRTHMPQDDPVARSFSFVFIRTHMPQRNPAQLGAIELEIEWFHSAAPPPRSLSNAEEVAAASAAGGGAGGGGTAGGTGGGATDGDASSGDDASAAAAALAASGAARRVGETAALNVRAASGFFAEVPRDDVSHKDCSLINYE
jgi:hypothetical protein